MMTKSYDHNPDHFRFKRTLDGKLEDKLPPLQPYWKDMASAVGLIVFMIASFVVASGLAHRLW